MDESSFPDSFNVQFNFFIEEMYFSLHEIKGLSIVLDTSNIILLNKKRGGFQFFHNMDSDTHTHTHTHTHTSQHRKLFLNFKKTV